MQRARVPVPSWLNRSVSDVPSKPSPRYSLLVGHSLHQGQVKIL